jgi:hypothetical protein
MLREDRATNEPRPVTYPITLRDVDRPGLPAPVDPAEERARLARKLGLSDDAAARPNVVTGSGDDPVLDESVRILSDYVGLLSAPAARAAVVRT